MKKLLSAILISSLLLSFAACGNNDSAEEPKAEETVAAGEEETATAETEETSSEEAASSEAEGDDIVIDVPVDESKTVYWATVDKEPSDVCYHKQDCPIIKDKTPDVLSWEIIKALGMPPCEECKPLD